jgi:ankyrin repeat protein
MSKKKSPPATSDTAHSELFSAIENGDVRVVLEILRAHPAAVNARNPNGAPALWIAANRAHLAVARALVAHGADVNARFELDQSTPLHEARCSTAITRLLLDRGADASLRDQWGKTALQGAADDSLAGSWAPAARVARLLIRRGAEYDLESAISLNDPKRVRTLLRAEPELFATISTEDHAFHLWNAVQSLAVLKLLLEYGADPNVRTHNKVGPGALFRTPVIFAADDAETLSLLLKHGADPNLLNIEGKTRLDVAVSKRDKDAQTVLRRFGAVTSRALRNSRSTKPRRSKKPTKAG